MNNNYLLRQAVGEQNMHEHSGFLDDLVAQNKKGHIYVLYHNFCTDGSAAKAAAWYHLGDRAEYIPVNYNEDLPDMVLDEETEIYILDFCIGYHDLVTLRTRVKLVQIIDHHTEANEEFITEMCVQYVFIMLKYWFSSIEYCTDFSAPAAITTFFVKRSQWLFKKMCRYMEVDPPIFDSNKSGALLSWEYFHPTKPIPDIIRFVSDRDLWQFKYSRTKAAIEGLKQSGRMDDFQYWYELFNNPFILQDCINKGQTVIDYNQAHYKKFINSLESFKLINFDGLVGAVYNATSNVNELAEEFYLNGNFHVDFTLSYYIKGNGCIKMSFRSRNPGGADVRIQAGRWGGRGHEHSSGANLSMEESLKFLEFLQTAESLPLEP